MWEKYRPGLYVKTSSISRGEIERGFRGWWWWFVSDVSGYKKGAGRCLSLRQAKKEAEAVMSDPQLKIVK